MTFLDLFAGVGGFRRGMELAGHECVGFCEWDKFATASYISMHCITDEQREYLATLDLKQRQKEILKDEYRNGEWYADDIRSVDARTIPRADCWCFGFPCQDISIAGKRLGFAGSRSSLFFATTKIIRELADEDRPKLLFIENVKNLLSVNGGFDFARLLIELDDIGYDAEWQVCNSKDFGVPQNRERVFIVGHLRGSSGSAVFPVQGCDGENSVHEIGRREGGSLNLRTYDPDGICGTVEGVSGGGHEPNVAMFCDLCYGTGGVMTDAARAIQARQAKGCSTHYGACSGVAVPVLTPDREEKRQNGRRFKEDGEEMFTLTGQDKHGNQGTMVRVNDNLEVYAVWSEKYQCHIAIRKLTPKECFRLQGWTDDYFDKAQFVNSDSQLYKQAGNGVTVNVIEAIAKRLEVET